MSGSGAALRTADVALAAVPRLLDDPLTRTMFSRFVEQDTHARANNATAPRDLLSAVRHAALHMAPVLQVRTLCCEQPS